MSELHLTPKHPNVKLIELRCRRTGRMTPVAEHLVCPYCSGTRAMIEATGNYADFCDYEPGVDPVQFGFPVSTTRNDGG